MTIFELYIDSHRNPIRSQIPRITEATDVPLLVSDRIADYNCTIEKNIRPVKKGSKPFSEKKFPTASEVV